MSTHRPLQDLVRGGSAKVGVMGLGYVGLVEAMEFARAGFATTGFDIDADRVRRVQAGQSYLVDVTDEELGPAVASGKLTATGDMSRLSEMDAILICVPTPLGKTRAPDLSYIVSAVDAIRQRLRPGQLIVLESTTYPGTTWEVVLPALESTGLKVGTDFYLCFSPERINPGDKTFTPGQIPRILGGVTPTCVAQAADLYARIAPKVVVVSSTQAAEMVKLLENTFRAVNIGLVNELALMCRSLGVDVWEIIRAAATKPFGFMPFYPGPGLGGHCIPIDPLYLSWKARVTRIRAAFHRARPSCEHLDAARRPLHRHRRAQRTRPEPQGLDGSRARRELQARRQRCAGVAGRRDHGRAVEARRDRPVPRSLRARPGGRGKVVRVGPPGGRASRAPTAC